MAGREFFLWQVRSLTVRISLDFVDALNRTLAEQRAVSDVEVGGILLGRVLSTSEIEVSGFELVQSGHHRGVIYSLGLREQLSLADRVARLNRKSEPKPVGFFRSHLRRGLFLDQDDFSLMQEAFGGPSQFALLIRPDETGAAKAGIFTWEEGDIDRRQTDLFPFASDLLRAQGPVESVAPPARHSLTPSLQLPSIPVRWLAWGAATAAGALALGAVLPKLPFRSTSTPKQVVAHRVTVRSDTPKQPAPIEIAKTEEPPPAFVAPKPDESASTPVKRFDMPPPTQQTQPAPAVVVVPPPPLVPVVTAAVEPIPAPALPVSRLASPPERKPAVSVAVSLEARQSSELKKVVSHVPLFGHLAHAEGGSAFSPARPEGSIEPRVPSSMASSLPGLLDVDLKLTIDKHGSVTNYEVLHGAGTQFASLALSSAGNASWEPAREGAHTVASDIIVHYRFQPAR